MYGQKTIKLLEENIGGILFDIHHSKIFFDPPPGVLEIKTNINKCGLIKLKTFCIINKIKRQSSEWEKIVASETIDKGLIFRIYKRLIQLNIRKTNRPIKKWAEDLKIHFSKDDIQMDNKHVKR